MTHRARRGPRVVALAAGAALALSACGGADPAPGAPPPSSAGTVAPGTSTTTTAAEWAGIDERLAAMGPDVGFLAARVSPDGTCEPIHAVDASSAQPTASQFKLFVLGALAEQVEAGEIAWDQTLTIDDATKSLGNGEGSLQSMEPGTPVTVQEAASKMIAISDNTAADMLLGLVGRDAVEARARAWVTDPAANDPFLTTRQMFLLHYVPGLADRYLATPADQQAAFLASEVDPNPITAVGAGLTAAPSHIDEIEWFATPEDVCTAFAGLQQQSTDPALAPLSAILSGEVRGLDLDPSAWPTVWYKGGSEPGVLTMGWLATNDRGETFVVQAMVANPEAALADSSLTDLVALAEDAYGLLG